MFPIGVAKHGYVVPAVTATPNAKPFLEYVNNEQKSYTELVIIRNAVLSKSKKRGYKYGLNFPDRHDDRLSPHMKVIQTGIELKEFTEFACRVMSLVGGKRQGLMDVQTQSYAGTMG